VRQVNLHEAKTHFSRLVAVAIPSIACS